MSHNTWIHRGVRILIRPLVRTPITPNHLTSLRLLCGFGAAGAFALGTPEWQSIGAIVFLVSMVLDRADGELARLSGKTSPGGHTYDLVSDALSNGLAFVGLGIGYIGTALGLWAVGLGFLAGGAVATILLMVMRAEASSGSRSAELQGAAGFDPDDAIIVVPIAVLLGGGEILLIAAAFGAPLFACFFFWRFLDTFRLGN